MKSPDHQLGYRLKAARIAKNLTQEKLAEAIDVFATYIAEIENKRTIPSAAVLISLCRYLNVSIDDIIFQTESDSAKSITRLLSECSEKQLQFIQAMIETMLQVGLHE